MHSMHSVHCLPPSISKRAVTLSDEKLDESLEGVLEYEIVVEREVWTSPRALENNASNRLVECAPLLVCPHALAHGKKEETVNKDAKIEHRLRVSNLPQEVMISAMKVHSFAACLVLQAFG